MAEYDRRKCSFREGRISGLRDLSRRNSRSKEANHLYRLYKVCTFIVLNVLNVLLFIIVAYATDFTSTEIFGLV